MTYDIRKLTGSDYCYHYEELPVAATEEQIQAYCLAIKTQFFPIAKALDERTNAIWSLRYYLAVKFASAAAILSGSAEYARDRNLLLGVPYFNYYCLLNCCRSFLLTSPDIEWAGTATLEMSHTKIINRTADLMKRLDRNPDRRWQERLEAARDYRELYSYRFPARGARLVDNAAFDTEGVARFARLIAELAMLHSECFDASLAKNGPEIKNVPVIADQDWVEAYDVAGTRLVDHDDRYRFRKFSGGWGRVSTLQVMTSDGLLDDLYGNWCADDPDEGGFDPDAYASRTLAL